MSRESKRRPANVMSDQCSTCNGSGYVPNAKRAGRISPKGRGLIVGKDEEGNKPPAGHVECGPCGGVGDSGLRGRA